MAGLINQLLDVLNEQSERYNELLGLSLEKKEVIVANDVDALQKITHLENLVVNQNQKLEKTRLGLIDDMALVLNQKAKDLTLSALIELMKGQAEQSALIEVGQRIKSTLEALNEANHLNASLIQNALDYIEYSINVMHTSASGNPALYSAMGEPLANNPGVFDARN